MLNSLIMKTTAKATDVNDIFLDVFWEKQRCEKEMRKAVTVVT